jgi:hypothetical protein
VFAGAWLWANRINIHLSHQCADVTAAHFKAQTKQLKTQAASAHKGEPKMWLMNKVRLDLAHQL